MGLNIKVYLVLLLGKGTFSSLWSTKQCSAENSVRNFKFEEIGTMDSSREMRETNAMGHFHYSDVRSHRFNVRSALYLTHTICTSGVLHVLLL